MEERKGSSRSRSANKLLGEILQEEIKHLKETKTMLVPNSSKKPFLARSGRGRTIRRTIVTITIATKHRSPFPYKTKSTDAEGTTTNLSTRKPKWAGNRCKSEH